MLSHFLAISKLDTCLWLVVFHYSYSYTEKGSAVDETTFWTMQFAPWAPGHNHALDECSSLNLQDTFYLFSLMM
jgi:hypothetical protein